MAKKRAARPARKTRKAAQQKASKAAARVRRSASKAAKKARKTAKKARKSVAKARKRATGRLAATRTRAAKAARAAKRKTKKTATAARKSLANARKKAGRTTSKAAAKARRASKTSKPAVKRTTSQVAKLAAAPSKAIGSARTAVRAVVAGVTAAVTPPRTTEAARRPNLDRPRRTVADIHGVPSTLDRERAPSAAMTGRAEFEEKLQEHTSTSPALTAGDVDADWASAESVGDEAPGGDNPTPDQDVVDEIGRALGVEYDDDEELRGGEEISARDRRRWELDPDSKDDFDDEG